MLICTRNKITYIPSNIQRSSHNHFTTHPTTQHHRKSLHLNFQFRRPATLESIHNMTISALICVHPSTFFPKFQTNDFISLATYIVIRSLWFETNQITLSRRGKSILEWNFYNLAKRSEDSFASYQDFLSNFFKRRDFFKMFAFMFSFRKTPQFRKSDRNFSNRSRNSQFQLQEDSRELVLFTRSCFG